MSEMKEIDSKVQPFWEGQKKFTIFLMVLTFTKQMSKPWGKVRKLLWPSQKSWALLYQNPFIKAHTFDVTQAMMEISSNIVAFSENLDFKQV